MTNSSRYWRRSGVKDLCHQEVAKKSTESCPVSHFAGNGSSISAAAPVAPRYTPPVATPQPRLSA